MHDAHDHRIPPALPARERARLAALVARVGERRALALLNISRNLLARATAGLPVRAASAAVIESRLDALDAQRGRERV